MGVVLATRERINVEGRSVSYVTGGAGAPTVVLEAGLGGTAATWAPVIERLEGRSRVVAYDRAGYGASADGLLPRTAQRLARELDDFLRAAQVPPPFVLVGHSWGGIIVRIYAVSRPETTAAMVLVDPTVEGLPSMQDPRSSRTNQIVFGAASLLSRAGIIGAVIRAGRPGIVARALSEFSPQQREALAADYSRAGTLRAARAEGREVASSLRAVPDVAGPHKLPDVPFALLSATRAPRRQQQLRTQFRTIHAGLAGAMRQGRLIDADSGHFIPQTDPQLVADLIGEVVDAVRSSSGASASDGGGSDAAGP